MTDEGRAVSGMGSEFRDFDNDGRPDIVFTALAGETFPLFRNLGSRQFKDWTYQAGLGMAAARLSGWGLALADLNNDGWKDLVTANSHVTDNIEAIAQYEYRQTNAVFLNAGGRFGPPLLFGAAAAHRGLAVADLDNDGRLDVVVTGLGTRPELWRNITPAVNRWVRIAGVKPGETLRVANQTATQSSGGGYGSSVLGPLHFGLGSEAGPAVLVERLGARGETLQILSCPPDILSPIQGGPFEHEKSHVVFPAGARRSFCEHAGGPGR